MDDGKLNCVVFLDVRKAFDSINHETLIDKMRKFFVVTGDQLKWFKSYLNNRVQQCLVSRQLSSSKMITCGVPQGSILGPLLLVLYINDMPDSLSNSTVSHYADDTDICASSYDYADLVGKINTDHEISKLGIISGATYDTRSSDLFQNLNWKSLEERRKYLYIIYFLLYNIYFHL